MYGTCGRIDNKADFDFDFDFSRFKFLFLPEGGTTNYFSGSTEI